MAIIPVAGALVDINVAGQRRISYSDASGTAVSTFRLTQKQYEHLASISGVVSKANYFNSEIQNTSLPPFETAISSGISMSTQIYKTTSSNFTIIPAILNFTTAGGTKTITVNAPTDTWTYSVYDSRLTVTKTNSTTLTVVCPAGLPVSDLGHVTVEWNNGGGSLYEFCNIQVVNETPVTITVRGKVVNQSTGLPISANVEIKLETTTLTFMWIGSVVTDSSGQYEVSAQITQSQYNSFDRIESRAISEGYIENYYDISPLPDWGTITTTGYTFPDLQLEAITEDPRKPLYITGRVVSLATGRPITTGEVRSSSNWLYPSYSVLDSNGVYRFSREWVTESDYNQIRTEGVNLNTIITSGEYANQQASVTLPTWANLNSTITGPTFALEGADDIFSIKFKSEVYGSDIGPLRYATVVLYKNSVVPENQLTSRQTDMFGGVSSSFIYTLGEYNNTTAFIVIVSMPGYQTVQRSIPMTSWADLQTNGINTGRITLTPTS